MQEAYIFDAVRTPRGKGKKDGALVEVAPTEMSVQVLAGLRDRNTLDTALVDDIVFGIVEPIGEQGGNVARTAAIQAGYDERVGGMQVNRFCSSGLEACNIAAARVMSGASDFVIGGGVECMSRVTIGDSGMPLAADPLLSIPNYFVPQGIAADLVATKYGYSRTDLDAYAVESQKRAKQSWDEGRFDKSILPVTDDNGLIMLDHDEYMRPQTDMQSLGSLAPSFQMMGEFAGFDDVARQRYPEIEKLEYYHHAGNSSGIVDGAAAVLIGSADGGKKAGLKPRARIKAFASIGSEPTIMLTGPAEATKRLFERTGMTASDIDLWELNEAFAAVVLRYMDQLNIGHDDINVNGGAIAMGHPLGATGAMILGTALDELERSDKETALVTLCIGSGMGIATVIERV
ncbi:MAG: acetyl-CoA C-acetyltransferase [Sphingomonadales bacterium]